jgi:hypothetical protein
MEGGHDIQEDGGKEGFPKGFHLFFPLDLRGLLNLPKFESDDHLRFNLLISQLSHS